MAMDLPPEEVDEGEAWLGSFSDMVSLLLCFFIVLTAVFSMREDGDPFIMQDMLAGLQDMGKTKDSAIERKKARQGMLESLEKLDEENENVEFEKQNDGIKISFNEAKGKSFFKPGSAILTRDAQYLIHATSKSIVVPDPSRTKLGLEEFLAFIDKTFSAIEIQGHTDSQPIGSKSIYPSNWELSVTRANNVRRFLEKIDLPEILLNKIRVVGYADNDAFISESEKNLFRLNSKFVKELNNEMISDSLREEFAKTGQDSLFSDAYVRTVKPELEWKIFQDGPTYIAKASLKWIDIYRELDPFEQERARAQNRRIVIFFSMKK